MKIDQIEVYYVALPLNYPWRTAYGEDPDIHSVLVKLVSGDYTGWGETTPFRMPTYSPESAMSVYCNITDFLAPLLVGKNLDSAEALLDCYNFVKGNPFAKAGPEIAWWNLKAKIEGKPLHELFGGTLRKVEAGADFGVQDSHDMLLEKLQQACDRGYKRIKLKVRRGWDLEMLKIVRSTFPDMTFHIDCNSGYTLQDMDLFKKIDKLGLEMIEQPLHHTDLLDHAELQKQLDTPVCLDESITSIRSFELALRLKSCRYLNIKTGRVGGLSIAIKLHHMARKAGIPCWVGSMLESGIGEGILIELGTLNNFTYPGDIFPSNVHYRQDITDPEVILGEDCTYSPSRVPGTPYEPIMERVEAVSLYSKTIRPE
jgi:o-succinylbenzoate synthase